MQFPPSELVLNDAGQVYHLGLSPSTISDKIILVGDQDRVEIIARFFDSIECSSQHREFCTTTGLYKGNRITIVSTGIGTDNIDIVMNELDALVNIDLLKREEKVLKSSLTIVRIGTCGILQSEIPLHSFVMSTHAFGLDNIAHFYPIQFTEEEIEIGNELTNYLSLPEKIQPYLTKSSELLANKFDSDCIHKGITVTSSGFYGPQGRSLRLGLNTVDMNERLTSFRFRDHKVVNFEMESSALFALGKAMGHQCITLCLGVANRPNNEFTKGCTDEMNALITYVLDRI